METTTSSPVYGFKRLSPDAIIPTKGTPSAAAYDLHALADTMIDSAIGTPIIIPTGIAIKIPPGHYASIRERSGLALKGVSVGGGVIDADYYPREVCVILRATQNHLVKKGDRIAQVLIERISDTTMGEITTDDGITSTHAGFGSTGK